MICDNLKWFILLLLFEFVFCIGESGETQFISRQNNLIRKSDDVESERQQMDTEESNGYLKNMDVPWMQNQPPAPAYLHVRSL